MKSNTYLFFNGQCAAAFKFYEQCLGGKITSMMTYGDSPMAEQSSSESRDRIMNVILTVGDVVLMGSDAPPENFNKPQGFDVNLEFDKNQQLLVGRVKVTNIQLGSVANLAGGIFARFLQSTIDKKVNPIEILKTDKFDFVVPIKPAQGSLRVKANNIRHEVGEGFVNIIIGLEFLKADSQ